MPRRTATCPLCEAACGLVCDVEDGRLLSVRGDDEDPFSRGYICPKAAALIDLHDDPDRLRSPLIRTGRTWQEASWDEALSRAADGLRRVRAAHGRDAVAVYHGNPVAHNLGLMTHLLPFARLLRTRHIYSASSADQLPQMLVALQMYGHLALIPVPDLERTTLLLIIGANPLTSNGSLMTAPNVGVRLKALQARGGCVVVVDPRRTETAAAADAHLAIVPGTDAWLLAALLQTIFAERLERLGHLEAAVVHLDHLRSLVAPFTPEAVAARTGLPADDIRRLARTFASTDGAACYVRVGACTQRLGTLVCWLAQALNLVTGHLDAVGGMMFTTPAVDAVTVLARAGMRGTFDRWRSHRLGLPEFAGDLPVATLADEIDDDHPRRVRALITAAGNPVLSVPNGARLDRSFAALDHMVSIDPYLNETTRHAHVILPPPPPLSRAHYDLALLPFAVRNVAKYSDPVIPRLDNERHDWEIVAELAARVLTPPAIAPLASAAARWLRPERLVDILLRLGPHRLSLATLRAHPHGLDLGPLEGGRLLRQLRTRDRTIDVAPDLFVRDAREHLAEPAREPSSTLLLIGRRDLRSNNSWMHNAPRLVKGPDRCVLLMHPDDAAARGLEAGDAVAVTSEAGALTVPVAITDSIRQGVVSLPHGWGHHRADTRLGVAHVHAGVSMNDITSERLVDTVSGNAAVNGVPVQVQKCDDTRAWLDSGSTKVEPHVPGSRFCSTEVEPHVPDGHGSRQARLRLD